MPKTFSFVTPPLPAWMAPALHMAGKPNGCTGLYVPELKPKDKVLEAQYDFSLPDHFSPELADAMKATVRSEFLIQLGLIYTDSPNGALPVVEHLVSTGVAPWSNTYTLEELKDRKVRMKAITEYIVTVTKDAIDATKAAHTHCTDTHCYSEDLRNEFKD